MSVSNEMLLSVDDALLAVVESSDTALEKLENELAVEAGSESGSGVRSWCSAWGVLAVFGLDESGGVVSRKREEEEGAGGERCSPELW